jgi:predicted DNA-binding mobile mystery protein A
MSQEQLGRKLQITRQSVQELEKREKEGTITLKTLKEVANVLDIKLVYGFIPNQGSLEALIEKKANELATRIVMRTSNTMKLEDQQNSDKRIQKAIKERTRMLINEMPKILWD